MTKSRKSSSSEVSSEFAEAPLVEDCSEYCADLLVAGETNVACLIFGEFALGLMGLNPRTTNFDSKHASRTSELLCYGQAKTSNHF